MISLIPMASSDRFRSSMIALAVSLLLIVMAPFSTALAIHHDLAAADHDGHEHSDTDLCQWVQYHTGHSLIGEVPAVSSIFHALEPKFHYQPLFISPSLSDSLASRAPPAP
ncbi:MAG: hypothetical protein AB7R40_08015 [Nitrospiraceae bacterium]